MKCVTKILIQLCIVAVLLTVSQLHAQEDEAQGEKSQLHETQQPESSTPDAVTDVSVEQYLAEIEELEKQHGPYDSKLGEQLLALGQTYLNQQQYDEATKVLAKALHIVRVNDGMESMSQAPVLNLLLASASRAGDWQQLDQGETILLQMYKNNYEANDPTLINVVNRVGRWKLIAYNYNLLKRNRLAVLQEGRDIFQSHIDLLSEQYGDSDPSLIIPLKGLAQVQYVLVNEAAAVPLEEYTGFGEKTVKERICRPVLQPDGRVTMECEEVDAVNPHYYSSQQSAKDTEVKNHMFRVLGSLDKITKIYESNPELSDTDHAIALIHIGDWNLINGLPGKAFTAYSTASEILVEGAVDDETVELLLGKPRRIPLNLMLEDVQQNDEFVPAEGQAFVKLSFDVLTDGRTKRVKVIEQSDPDNRLARKMAKERIEASMFRPRIENGEPVKTKKNTIYLTGVELQR